MTVAEPKIPLRWVHRYVSPRQRPLSPRETHIRAVALALKTADPGAVEEAAAAMAAVIERAGGADVLVPIPGASGDLTANRELADRIAAITGAWVEDAVHRTTPGESSYARRRAGGRGLTRAQHASSMRANPGGRVWLVDNVITSGNTMLGAWDAMGRPDGVRGIAWAKAPSEEDEMPAFVDNPPWLARAIAENFQLITTAAKHPMWEPVLDKIRAVGRGNRITADVAQLGCGAYGCVMPTMDAGVVFKVTSDDTEVEFVRLVLPQHPQEGIVRYYDIVELEGEWKKSKLFGVWRENANGIGKVSKDATALLRDAHTISDTVYRALHDGQMPGELDELQRLWTEMANDADELMWVGQALLGWLEVGILVADIHDQNVGHVTREGRDLVVITDPGHVAVLPR